MTLRRYRAADGLEVSEWYKARAIETPRAQLPEVGYIIDGVAAGFMIQTDTDVAFIEGLVSNPRASKQSRDKALDMIVGAIERKAAELGYAVLVGWTRQDVVLSRAHRNFFKKKGDFMMVAKEIGNGLHC